MRKPFGDMVKDLFQRVKNCLRCRRHRRHEFGSWVWKIPWRREWQPIPVFLPEKSHGQRSLVGYSPKSCKEVDRTEHEQGEQCSMSKANNAAIYKLWAFPGGSDGEESVCNAGDPGSIPGSERSPGGGNGNPLQYSCPENSMDRGSWRATQSQSMGVSKNWTRLND